MTKTVSVSPFECRMWTLHERMEDYVDEITCRSEIESYAQHGQLIPVLGRPINGDLSHGIELVYGARRLFAARHLNMPLLVELRELSDREAIIAMDIENRQRKNISPYERGQSYARWLRTKHFQSQDDIARALKISKSQVSRLLKLTKLPSVIVAAFGSPLEICEGWGLELVDVWEDAARRSRIAQRARAIAAQATRPPSAEIYRQLLDNGARQRGSRASRQHDEVVKDENGIALFRIRHRLKSVAVVIPRERLSESAFERIRSFVAGMLQAETAETIVSAQLVPYAAKKEPHQTRNWMHVPVAPAT
jgi:ParB family chromosome partitioning protein